jgi:hypothetical protein
VRRHEKLIQGMISILNRFENDVGDLEPGLERTKRALHVVETYIRKAQSEAERDFFRDMKKCFLELREEQLP